MVALSMNSLREELTTSLVPHIPLMRPTPGDGEGSPTEFCVAVLNAVAIELQEPAVPLHPVLPHSPAQTSTDTTGPVLDWF